MMAVLSIIAIVLCSAVILFAIGVGAYLVIKTGANFIDMNDDDKLSF